MHSSWLFPGAIPVPRQPGDASGDRSQPGATFEINSFVRSLNLHGTHLAGGFPFKTANSNNNKREWSEATAGRSLNEFLNILNESVDRVAECGSKDRSNTSSYGSFRSGIEDREPADLNDLINLVSSTANEFHEISSRNGKRSSGKNCHLRSATQPLDIGMGTQIHAEIRARKENFSTPEAPKYHPLQESNDTTSGPPLKKRRSPQSHSKDPRTGEFMIPTEFAEIYSKNQSSSVKRGNTGAESSDTLRYLETPRYFLPEVIRMAKAAALADSSQSARDGNRGNWGPRRINFDDELWPIGHSGNNGKPFTTYFTGSSPKASFPIRSPDKNLVNDNNRSINSSRSSPIFAGAGEALSEPLEIVVPTRDREDEDSSAKTPEGNRINQIDTIGITPEDNFLNVSPTKLNKNFAIVEEEDKSRAVTNISINVPEEVASSGEDKTRRKACVKVLTKRHRSFSRQNQRGWKKSSVNADDDGTSEISSTSQSFITSPRKSPLQRFYEESGNGASDEEKLMSVKGEDDSVETQIGLCGKTYRVYNEFSTKIKSSKMSGDEKNKLPQRWKVSTESQEPTTGSSKRPSSVEACRSFDCPKKFDLKNSLQKCRADNSTQRIWRPAGNPKAVAPSTSSISLLKQSKIAQITTRVRPKTSETLNKSKEITEAKSKSRVPVVRKNQSQDFIAEKSGNLFLARKSEAVVKTPKLRSEAPNKFSRQDDNSKASSNQLGRANSNLKTENLTIPVMRSKTFVQQMRRDVSRVVSKEETKLTSLKSYQNSSPSTVKQIFHKSHKDCPAATKELEFCLETEEPFESRINTDDEEYPSGYQTRSNLDKSSVKGLSRNSSEKNTREEAMSPENKFHNKHAPSLLMLKNILSNQGVSVEGVNKAARDIRSKIMTDPAKKSRIPGVKKSAFGSNQSNTAPIGAPKSLFEKLAVLTETQLDREDEEQDSCVESISSFTESTTSYGKSMRDAEEQCSFSSEASILSQTAKSSKATLHEVTKQVSNASTEMDEDYRKFIYVDAAVSPSPSETEVKSFEAAETQTVVKLLDKNSATEEIEPEIVNAFTETHISSVSKEANTDLKANNVDATSQINPADNCRNIAAGKDSSEIQCPSKDVNTERPANFLKSRGVCVRGPRKIDGGSQFHSTGISTASGKDYVENSVSESVNTDRQDYLFEDRSVNVLPATAEESCQIYGAKIVNVAVGDFSLEVKSSPEEIFRPKAKHHLHTIETVVVKDVDVVQWQSSTTFNTRINCGSSCSSNSSLVTWHPQYSRRTSAERLDKLGNRVPKEAIVALEIANQRAQNLYKAIEIYRENLASKNVEMVSIESVENAPANADRGREIPEIKETCSFRENSRIKSLLDANLQNIQTETKNENPEVSAKDSAMEEIADAMNDLLVEVVDSESDCVWEDADVSRPKEEHFAQKKSTVILTEIIEEEQVDEEKILSTSKTFDVSLFSRNSLLTVIYGTVCSLVFWALQFSITCDSV